MAMFEKFKIKKRIRTLLDRIALMEKRERSQAALVEAILTGATPHDADVDYFNRYTSGINEIRDEIRNLQKKLDELQRKTK